MNSSVMILSFTVRHKGIVVMKSLVLIFLKNFVSDTYFFNITVIQMFNPSMFELRFYTKCEKTLLSL